MVFSLHYVQQQMEDNKKCRQIAGNFDCHADVLVRCGAHCPMEHILSFTRSHWMSPLGECSHRIAVAATMVNSVENTKH